MSFVASRCALVAVCALPLPLATGCGGRARLSGSQPEEAWDVRNAPSIFGYRQMRYEELVQPAATHGQLAERPWEDDYWPFIKKNMARRYLSDRDFQNVDDQINDAKANKTAVNLSPAEKYDLITGDNSFPITHESWTQYTSRKKQYGNDDNAWDWMGICGGWTPAAMLEKPPRSSVLVTNAAGIKVLFFEGDIRGLMSKAYDLNQTSQGRSTIGSRCDEQAFQVQRDAAGRPVDGYYEDTKQSFSIVSDFWADQGTLEVTSDPATMSGLRWLVSNERDGSLDGEHSVFLYDNRDSALADIRDNQIGAHAAEAAPRRVRLIKACRAINPGAFHLALVQGYSDAASRKEGFIVEIERIAQIWNQPLFGFTTDIGAPVPVADAEPALRRFRSPDAAYVVKVRTKIAYIDEAHQVMMHYDDLHAAKIDFSQPGPGNVYLIREFAYTLELDNDGAVVGGEWSEHPGDLAAAPSFIWKPLGGITDTSMDGKSSPLKASLIRKIRDCSFDLHQTPIEATTKFGTQQIQAASCTI